MAKRNGDIKSPSDEQAESFDRVQPMLAALHRELSELSKKKQDGVLNALKVRHVNRLLAAVKACLGRDPSVAFLEQLDEETLPENSDAVLILGQWLAAMEQFKSRHYYLDSLRKKRWITREHPGEPFH
jgi:hypothetical protein